VDSVDQLVKEYDLHINVLAYLQQSSNVNSSADLWMSKFGYSVIRASNTIQSSKIEAAKSALAVAEQSLIAQKTQARQQEEQLEALIEKINSIDENLQRLQYNLRQRKAQVALENKKLLQLPNDLYTHDHEYASRPENNGVIDVDPMVMGVIREAYGLLASYVQWPRNDANDKPVLDMMKDQSLRDDFAKIAGYKYQLAKAASSGSYSQRGALQRLDAQIAAVLVNYESHNDMLQDTIYMGAGSGYRVTGLNPVYPAYGTPVSFVNRLMKK
jgi:septal ring factor EnvC (AmiA/AmiB activator)